MGEPRASLTAVGKEPAVWETLKGIEGERGGEACRAGGEDWPGLKEDQLCPEGGGQERRE